MSKQNDNITLLLLRRCAILYHTYLLLICKGHIQITSNHSTTIVETKKQQNKQNDNTALLTLTSYAILYHTYLQLICKGHVR